MALKVTSNLIGGTELMASPSQKGSGWSCNCFPEHNGKNLFQASMYGLKYLSGLGVSGNIKAFSCLRWAAQPTPAGPTYTWSWKARFCA